MLEDVTLTLPEHGLFALCGPNGAGKSTLLNVIGGSVAAVPGPGLPQRRRHHQAAAERAVLPGHQPDVPVGPPDQGPHRARQRGGRLPGLAQVRRSRPGSRAAVSTTPGRRRRGRWPTSAWQHLAGREVSSLTLETQRMVELARALAPNPRLLLLDEPASGLSEEQRQRLAAVLTALASRTCVLLVEHDLALVAQVSERIFVLSAGPARSSTAARPTSGPRRSSTRSWSELTTDCQSKQSMHQATQCSGGKTMIRRRTPFKAAVAAAVILAAGASRPAAPAAAGARPAATPPSSSAATRPWRARTRRSARPTTGARRRTSSTSTPPAASSATRSPTSR